MKASKFIAMFLKMQRNFQRVGLLFPSIAEHGAFFNLYVSFLPNSYFFHLQFCFLFLSLSVTFHAARGSNVYTVHMTTPM